MVIITYVGLIQFNRLQQGIKNAPAEFQAIVDKIISGVSTIRFIDVMISCKKDDISTKFNFSRLELNQSSRFN